MKQQFNSEGKEEGLVFLDLPILENDIKKILNEVGLSFSLQGTKEVCLQIWGYQWMGPLFDKVPMKDEQIRKLRELADAATIFRNCLVNLEPWFRRRVPYLQGVKGFPNEAEHMAKEIADAIELALGQIRDEAGKKGRKRMLSRPTLIASLIMIFRKETRKNFIKAPGLLHKHGNIKQEYTRYDEQAFNFIFKIISSIDSRFTKNHLQKDLELLVSKGIVAQIEPRP